MKFILFLIILFFTCQVYAQKNDSVQAFGKAYFEHYKKKDYEWIRKSHDAYFKLAKEHATQNQKHKQKDKSTTWQHANQSMKYFFFTFKLWHSHNAIVTH